MASLNELLYDIRRIAEHREKLTEKKINSIYRTLMKDLDGFLTEGYKKYADEEGRLYVSNLDAHNKRAAFLQEVIKNVDGISPELQKEMTSVIEKTYKESYKGMVSALKQADTAKKFEEIVKDIDINPKVLKQAFNNNISKLTLPAVMEKHRQELIYQIQQELNIGLMQGDRYENMAKRIQSVLEGDGLTKGARGKSKNIVRTEIHRNVESGFMDCAEEIQGKLEGSDLIYAATWCSMKDERVRPQYRYKTKKGWKSGRSTNGANHQIMEGVTVKAGELFDLKDGNKTKAPSQSGVAKHDCNCRCFLEYNLMTIEEFAKATQQSAEAIKKKYFSLKTTDKQFGKKIGKHAKDFELDVTKEADRDKMEDIINDITLNYDEKRISSWRGQSEDVLFFIKGKDVVVTKQNREFITVLQEGLVKNERVKNARKRKF